MSVRPISLERYRYEVNSVASPLLALPYELRLQIYELVLGGRQIHIRFVPWQFKGRVKRSKVDNETVKGHFRYEVLPKRHDPWAPGVEQMWDPLVVKQPKRQVGVSSKGRQAQVCDGLMGARLTLLSGVCRQLYHETVLLPQKLNTWSFETLHLMERYILKENRMPLQQRRALHTLYCRERLPKDVQKKLKWLKVIVWKDGETLRWQDLEIFPDIAWKDRQELVRRSWRW